MRSRLISSWIEHHEPVLTIINTTEREREREKVGTVSNFFRTYLTVFCGSFLLFMFRVFHAFLSVHCSLVVAWPLGSLVCVFSCVFVTFP